MAYCHTPPTVSAVISTRRGAPKPRSDCILVGTESSASIDAIHDGCDVHQMFGRFVEAGIHGQALRPVLQRASAPGVRRRGEALAARAVEALHGEVVERAGDVAQRCAALGAIERSLD